MRTTQRNVAGAAWRSFPEQLNRVLDDMEQSGEAHIASWQPHGRCFKIHQRDQFVDTILGRSFHQSKYASFQRQLNIYGFKRIPSGPDKDSYYHLSFLWKQPLLARQIKREGIKGQGPRRPVSDVVPNFYADPLRPLNSKRTSTTATRAAIVTAVVRHKESDSMVARAGEPQTNDQARLPGIAPRRIYQNNGVMRDGSGQSGDANHSAATSVASRAEDDVMAGRLYVSLQPTGMISTFLNPSHLQAHGVTTQAMSDWHFLTQPWLQEQERRERDELELMLAMSLTRANGHWPSAPYIVDPTSD